MSSLLAPILTGICVVELKRTTPELIDQMYILGYHGYAITAFDVDSIDCSLVHQQ